MIARDLTEQLVAQSTLAESQLRLTEAQRLAHVGLWVWDAASDTVQLSEELYRIHGIDPLTFDGQMHFERPWSIPTTRWASALPFAKRSTAIGPSTWSTGWCSLRVPSVGCTSEPRSSTARAAAPPDCGAPART